MINGWIVGMSGLLAQGLSLGAMRYRDRWQSPGGGGLG